MDLKCMIERRKSFRKYTQVPVAQETISQIEKFAETMKPLYPDIGVSSYIVTADQVRFYLPWKTPQLIAICSQRKEGYLENAGFLYQQMDLYLQSIGLGSCWLGLAKLREVPAEDDKEFVILMAFGNSEEKLRESADQFKRRSLSQISDNGDPALEPARLAPSSTNSQPWYFTHEGETIHAFCTKGGLLKHKTLGDMNRIDLGIALSHLYVSNSESFRMIEEKPIRIPEGYFHITSFKI